MIAYFNGEFLPKNEIQISPNDRGFLFGDGAYEVIRSYEGRLFEPEAHIDRFERSIHSLRIEYPNIRELQRVSEDLIEKNNLCEGGATVYMQITRGAAETRTHSFPPEDTPITVYAFASPFQVKVTELEKGVNINIMDDIRWGRCDIKSINLLPNVIGNQAAKENTAAETVFIKDGLVTEGTHTNVFIISDGTLYTHPAGYKILSGITRNVIIGIANQVELEVKEQAFTLEQLRLADAVFLAGTTVEITPVISVRGEPIRHQIPGPEVKKLQEILKSLTG